MLVSLFLINDLSTTSSEKASFEPFSKHIKNGLQLDFSDSELKILEVNFLNLYVIGFLERQVRREFFELFNELCCAG